MNTTSNRQTDSDEPRCPRDGMPESAPIHQHGPDTRNTHPFEPAQPPAEKGDMDRCVFCGATGCLGGTAEHAIECPFTTGLWPVGIEDIRRGAACASCEQPFSIGDVAAQVLDPDHPAMEGAMPGATFSVCTGCAALGREVQR